MDDAISLLKAVYNDTQSIEIGIAELNRNGFSQPAIINALVDLLNVEVTDAEKWVKNSLIQRD